MTTDPRTDPPRRLDTLDGLLAAVHHRLGTAVADRITAQGGPPELRSPDLALDRLLATAHRSMGAATARRQSCESRSVLASPNQPCDPRGLARGPLADRSPAVRVKYREASLRLVRTYWPFDLAKAMRTAVISVHHLCGLLADTTQPPQSVHSALDALRTLLHSISEMPDPYRPPVSLTGLDYLAAVESVLADPAERLLEGLAGVRELLDEEVAPAVAAVLGRGETYLFAVDAVAQDLLDDLTHGCEEADALARAVSEVERASNDFTGADLRHAKLDGIVLDGILWDATTLWPPHWETRVRRSSLPSDAEHGILVVACEGRGTAVHADA
ncbi:MAG TPA: hypothetical protein VFP69_01715 [Streptomyces sp.]|nr:hypothetical protein [Streptomyces sp.]